MASTQGLWPGSKAEPLPAWFIPLGMAVLAFTFYMKRTLLNISLTLPVVMFMSLGLFRFTTDDVPSDYTLGAWAVLLPLRYLDRVILADESDYEYIGRSMVVSEAPATANGKSTKKGSQSSEDSWTNSKFFLACSLLFNVRGIGWRWQAKGIRLWREPVSPRWKFVLRRGFMALVHNVTTDIIGSVLVATSDWRDWSLSSSSKLVLHVLLPWMYGFWISFGLLSVYTTLETVCVATYLTAPWQWPSFFGNWSESYRLRTFWSSCYHQLLRRTLQTPAVSLCQLLGFRKGSFLSRYTQLYVVFFLSGLAHASGSLHSTQSLSTTLRCKDVQVFVAQAVMITFEDFIVWLWLDVLKMRSRFEETTATKHEKYIGYIWTCACLTATLSTYLGVQQTLGMLQMKSGPRHHSWEYVKKLVDAIKPHNSISEILRRSLA